MDKQLDKELEGKSGVFVLKKDSEVGEFIIRAHSRAKVKDGLLHSDDGTPALVTSLGTICYCVDGKFHREDGPAFIKKDGTAKYFLRGKEYDKKEWLKLTSKLGRSLYG